MTDDLNELSLNMNRLLENYIWLGNRISDLAQIPKYRNKFVAADFGQVLDCDKDVGKLKKRLVGTYGESIDHIAILFIPEKIYKIILNKGHMG